ncbi:MAG TPA: hypothetical protein PKJ26_05350 [Candidatus Woesebacteria bacterium]|nr:hypothetical protein [Candidatus Woesebacteria bacterium]
MRIASIISVLIGIAMLSGCMTAKDHREAVSDDDTGTLTVGNVQKEIRVGMSGADVAAALGSPNVVTTDEQRREVWIYDKISTVNAYSGSSGGFAALFLGLSEAGASSTTQKTLTVIIKYDADGKVRDFAYHASKF